jgi:hypothetical protein
VEVNEMIVKEFYKTRNDGVNLYKTYSDKDKYIKKVGTEELYSEAIDIDGAPYVYEETDIDIEKLEEPRLIP